MQNEALSFMFSEQSTNDKQKYFGLKQSKPARIINIDCVQATDSQAYLKKGSPKSKGLHIVQLFQHI